MIQFINLENSALLIFDTLVKFNFLYKINIWYYIYIYKCGLNISTPCIFDEMKCVVSVFCLICVPCLFLCCELYLLTCWCIFFVFVFGWRWCWGGGDSLCANMSFYRFLSKLRECGLHDTARSSLHYLHDRFLLTPWNSKFVLLLVYCYLIIIQERVWN